MFEPKYSYTDRLVSQLIKIEGLRVSINDLDLAYGVRHKLQMYSKSLDILHFAHLIEVEISLKDAEKLSTGGKLDGVQPKESSILQNVRNTLEFNRSNIADSYPEIDVSILLHINKLILTNWRETWDSRFRTIADSVDENEDPLTSWRDKSLNIDNLQNEINDLIEWYKDASTRMSSITRISITLFRLIEISPFSQGNTFTILAFIDYLLIKNGLSSKVYASFIRNFDTNQSRYLDAINLAKKSFDLTYFLETFSGGIIKDLNETKENISTYVVEEEKSKQQPFLDLNKRQLKILRYLQTVPSIKREDYCHMMEVSTMTAFRDLDDLVRKKLLKIDGKGRGTKYRLVSM